MVGWGRALLATGQIGPGSQVVREAHAGYARLRPPGHLEMALPLITLGTVYHQEGQLHESERVIREARAIPAKNPSSKDRAADAAGELGLTLRAMGKTAEADALFKEGHAILQAAFGDSHPSTRQALARVRGDDGANIPPKSGSKWL